jgi:hypothetical protein
MDRRCRLEHRADPLAPGDHLELPLGTFLHAVSCMHCMTVSLAQGGEELGTLWGVDTAERLFREAGFSSFEPHRLDHDPVNVYVVARP